MAIRSHRDHGSRSGGSGVTFSSHLLSCLLRIGIAQRPDRSVALLGSGKRGGRLPRPGHGTLEVAAIWLLRPGWLFRRPARTAQFEGPRGGRSHANPFHRLRQGPSSGTVANHWCGLGRKRSDLFDGRAGLASLNRLGRRCRSVGADRDQPPGQREEAEPDPPHEHAGSIHDQIPWRSDIWVAFNRGPAKTLAFTLSASNSPCRRLRGKREVGCFLCPGRRLMSSPAAGG
jgi:hypothetical protein